MLQCQQGMARAVATEDTLGIEYDEQTMCDVCRDVSGGKERVMWWVCQEGVESEVEGDDVVGGHDKMEGKDGFYNEVLRPSYSPLIRPFV